MSADRKLVVFTPLGGDSTNSRHTRSKWGALREHFYRKRLADVAIYEQGGLGLDRMRNAACANVLRDPEATELLFVDRDIGFRAQDVEAMLTSPFDVVGGAYPFGEIRWAEVAKVAGAVPPQLLPLFASEHCMSLSEEAVHGACSVHVPPWGEFLEVDAIGTDFMLIRKHVLEKYVETYRTEIEYRTDPAFDAGHEKMWLIFSCRRDPANDTPTGGYLSEDYYFCRQWKRMGGKIYCYADAHLWHTKLHTFESRLSVPLRFLRAQRDAEKKDDTKKLVLPGTSDFQDTLKKKGLTP